MNASHTINKITGLIILAVLATPVAAQDETLAAGKMVYDKWCGPCHDAGVDHPGTLALSAKYAGVKSPALEEWTDLPPAVTKLFVRNGVSIMPFFRKTEISDAELDNLAAYLARNTDVAGKAENPDAACDRDCLAGFIDQYMNAMIAHDPGVLPVTAQVKFTEDTIEMQLGQGLWEKVSKLTDYRMDILDVHNSTAISLTVVEENGIRVMFALRLKIENKLISEAETMVVRSREEGMIFNPDTLQKVSETMVLEPEPALRNTRDEMINIATLYPAGLKTGSFATVDVPFSSGAYRFENGQLMAGPGCTFFPGCEDIKNQRIPTLAGITHKVAAVDEEAGIVLLRMNFGPGATFDGKNTLNVWEAFKVYDNHMHAVEAFMEVLPIGAPSGWD